MYNDATHARCGVPRISVKNNPAHAGSLSLPIETDADSICERIPG